MRTKVKLHGGPCHGETIAIQFIENNDGLFPPPFVKVPEKYSLRDVAHIGSSGVIAEKMSIYIYKINYFYVNGIPNHFRYEYAGENA